MDWRPMRINQNEVREAKDSLTDSLLRLRDSLIAEQLRSAALGRSALDEAKAMKSASLRHMAKEIRMPWARGRLISRELSKASDNSKYGAWAPVLAFSLHSSRQIRKAWAGKKTADERALAAYKASKAKGLIEGSKKAANSEARKAEAASKEAQAKRDEAKRKAEEARDARVKAEQDAKAEQAKSDAAAAKLEAERLRAEKVIAEAKLKELLKIDFEAVQRELMAWRQDLDERERALAPEKTIADLSWAGGGDDSVIDSSGCVVKMVKEPYDPEKDMTLSDGSRRLAREQRLAREAVSGESSAVREKIVASLEKLYVEALRENRVIDAEFYRKTLKSLYPDWEFKVEK